jgi:hypothetical protein
MVDCKKFLTIAGVAALGAMTAVPAMAAAPVGFAGSFSGDYAHTSVSNGGGDANAWGFNGSGAFGFGNMDLGGQLDFGYHSWDVSGVSSNVNIWNVGGSLFWAPMMGRFGGTFSYNSASVGGGDVHFYNYGAIGEYYLSDAFTIAGRAGGWSLDVSPGSFSDSGGYVGGAFTGYVIPDLAIQGSLDYIGGIGFFGSSANVTNLGVLAEYLFSESTPISGYVSYTYTDVSCNGCGHASTWGLGLKFYTTQGPLVQTHRNGTLHYLSNPLALQFAL